MPQPRDCAIFVPKFIRKEDKAVSEAVKTDGNMTGWEEWIGSCALLDKHGNCAVDEKFKCSPKDMTCPFHKTAEEKAASDMLWRERMNALTPDEQEYYADKYHKGKMPWKDGIAQPAGSEADEN